MPHKKEQNRFISYKKECELSNAERIDYLTELQNELKKR